MSNVKTPQEIALMKQSGQICAQALKEVLAAVKAGVTTKHLDEIAEKAIKKQGGEISFQTVDKYPFTICTTVNDEVVHGMPTDYKLKDGDVLGIDIGALYQGWHSDLAESVIVGKPKSGRDVEFLAIGKKALKVAIDQARPGNKVGDISHAMQSIVEGAGFHCVRALTGHGVGRELHEEPAIPCFGKPGKGPELVENMVIAVEVIYNAGTPEVIWKNDDGWTISTEDESNSGLFERTVVITKKGPEILTPID